MQPRLAILHDTLDGKVRILYNLLHPLLFDHITNEDVREEIFRDFIRHSNTTLRFSVGDLKWSGNQDVSPISLSA